MLRQPIMMQVNEGNCGKLYMFLSSLASGLQTLYKNHIVHLNQSVDDVNTTLHVI